MGSQVMESERESMGADYRSPWRHCLAVSTDEELGVPCPEGIANDVLVQQRALSPLSQHWRAVWHHLHGHPCLLPDDDRPLQVIT